MTGRQAIENSEFTPRKMPSQARARATVTRILDGARRLLREKGADAVTTRNVADISGVRTGSIYQYFPNKESILFALYGSRMEETVETFEAIMTQENLKLPLNQFLQLFDQTLQTKLQWGKPEDVELDKAMGENPALRDAVADVLKRLYTTIVKLLRHYGSNWSDERLMQLAEYLYSLNHFGFAMRIRQSGEKSTFTRQWTLELQLNLMEKAIREPEPRT